VGKLVRDRIPDIIRAEGGKPEVRELTHSEYVIALRAKLREEVVEYLTEPSLEELADILEVVYALGCTHNSEGSRAAVELAAAAKAKAKGRFDRRLYMEMP